jgi:hypothetical protein
VSQGCVYRKRRQLFFSWQDDAGFDGADRIECAREGAEVLVDFKRLVGDVEQIPGFPKEV